MDIYSLKREIVDFSCSTITDLWPIVFIKWFNCCNNLCTCRLKFPYIHLRNALFIYQKIIHLRNVSLTLQWYLLYTYIKKFNGFDSTRKCTPGHLSGYALWAYCMKCFVAHILSWQLFPFSSLFGSYNKTNLTSYRTDFFILSMHLFFAHFWQAL